MHGVQYCEGMLYSVHGVYVPISLLKGCCTWCTHIRVEMKIICTWFLTQPHIMGQRNAMVYVKTSNAYKLWTTGLHYMEAGHYIIDCTM